MAYAAFLARDGSAVLSDLESHARNATSSLLGDDARGLGATTLGSLELFLFAQMILSNIKLG